VLSDQEIVKRVRDGRTQDFRWLIQRYHRCVYAVAYGILRRREDAEDVVQDVFVKVFRYLHTYSADRSLWSWVRRIAVNCCLDRLPNDVPMEDIDQIADCRQPFIDNIEAGFLGRCEDEITDSAVAGLPAAYRVVVVLRYFDGMTTGEIAETLSMPSGTVRARLHRALKMLAERLAVVRDEL
jgi:RNA polymerase sigma-70 factor (ECF subfamily)